MDLNSLPTELILEIVSHVPVLDYYNLKQAGSQRITAAVRQICASLPRGTYLSELVLEDQRRQGGRNAPRRRAMEIMVARGQCALIAHYEKKYSPSPIGVIHQGAKPKPTVPSRQEGDMWLDEEKRSFRLAVHWAAYYGCRNVVEALLHRIHLRGGKHGRTPVYFAALGGHLEVVEFLLKHGADVNALDYRGRTPLGVSVSVDEEQQSDVSRLLRAHGGKVDIFEVLDGGDEEWVKVYLDDQTTYKQFVDAARHLPFKLVQRFRVLRMWAGYRRKAPVRDRKKLAMMRWKIQSAALESGFASIFLVTLQKGTDINAPVDGKIGGGAALHWAVRKRHYQMIRALLQRGADPNPAPTPKSMTPWELAIENQDATAAQIFLDWGVSIDVRGHDGRTALHRAAMMHFSKAAFIDFLLEHNPDIHATDKDGDTPLHKAARVNRLLAIERLVKAGADVGAQNNEGRTALAEAIMEVLGHCEAIGTAPDPSRYSSSTELTFMRGIQRVEPRSTTRWTSTRRTSIPSPSWSSKAPTSTRRRTKATFPSTWLCDGRPKSSNTDATPTASLETSTATASPRRCFSSTAQTPTHGTRAGLVPLHLAEDITTWKHLLRHGARIDERGPDDRTTLLRLLVPPQKDSYSNLAYCAGILLAYGADPNAKDNRGYRPLMYAVEAASGYDSPRTPRGDLLAILLYFGADPFRRNPAGLSAFGLCGDVEVKWRLMKYYWRRPEIDVGYFRFGEDS
ncbi:ankyrin repeat-containing domain protein [Aspergillus insuetus]